MATLREQIATNVLTVTRFRELMKKLRENRPSDDLGLVKKAYEFSQKHHSGQHRASGEPYLVHPLEVANVLADMKMDSVSIAAGLLHDSVEDTSVTTVEIRQEFGEQVAHIVEGVTKISKIDFSSNEEAQAENLRKMMLAIVDDIRVVLIKLADRLHNMRTLEHLDPERREKIARETLDIYAPIAHRLGMGKIRGELEDLGFKYVDPIGFEQVRAAVESRRKAGETFMARVESVLRDGLKEAGITGRVESRIKRLYSIHKKLLRQRISVDQVYDLYAMRVITNSVQDCYAVLGIIHNLWRPVPAASRISSPCRGRISISRCTPPSSLRLARPSKSRFAPKKCTRCARKASPPTGNTRTGPSPPKMSSDWRGSGRWSSGSATSPIRTNSYPH